MIYFTVYLTFNEVVKLKNALDHNCFCLLEHDSGEYVGVVTLSCYDPLIDTLTAECLLGLEYLQEHEFEKLRKMQPTYRLGNMSLLQRK